MEKRSLVAAGLGEVVYDHDVKTDRYTFGGAPANFADHFLKCAVLLAERLQAEVYVVSAVGMDAKGIDKMGRKVLRQLKNRGLRAALTRVGDLPTGIVDKFSDAGGNNTYKVLPGAWDAIEWSSELENLALRCDVVCFGSLAQRSLRSRRTIVRFLKTMISSGRDTLRVFDVNIRLPEGLSAGERKAAMAALEPVLKKSIDLCNVLKISEEEASVVSEILIGKSLAGDERAFCRELLAGNKQLKTVILTEGGKGNCVFTPGHESAYVIPAGKRRKLVNTVGAGDSFTAAFCAELMAGSDLWQAQTFASKVAAFVCRRASATPHYSAAVLENFAG